MSIEGKHAYRFEYLKSDKWQAVRLQALVREKGKCQICGEESISNDAHHVWYPPSMWDTTERHLVILCRCCHDFVHAVLPDCKTNDEDFGIRQWSNLKNAILTWRRDKQAIFSDPSGLQSPEEDSLKPKGVRDLRSAYEKLIKKVPESKCVAPKIRENDVARFGVTPHPKRQT